MPSFYPVFYARENCNVSTFCEILFENYIQAKIIVEDVEKIDDIELLYKKLYQIFKYSVNSAIYSIMIVESFMNDYLAAVLGDKEYYNRYDYLSTENKINLCYDFIFKKS